MGIRSRTAVAVFVMLVSAAASAQASTILFASLTNGAENPPTVPTLSPGAGGAPRPASFGFALFELNDAMTQLTVSVTVFNIDFTGSQTPDTFDNLINAHIHAGPAVTPLTNGPVVWGFIGMPFHDLNQPVGARVPFSTGVGGTFQSVWDLSEGVGGLATQLPFILNGQAYINFHTTQFSGGEIRGNIEVMPEPSTLVLLGLGGAVARWRHRRARA